LIATAEQLGRSVAGLAKAGKAEEYTGPVLFTGEAAGIVFDQLLADKLTDPAPPVSAGPRGGQLARGGKLTGQVGRRVLPAGFQVVDDPTRASAGGTPLLGSYAVDDDGVKPEPVMLVEDGLLKSFYMSRIPTKEIPATNGHGRRTGGRVTGQPSNLLITVENGEADLKARLLTLCKEEGLPYALIVERFEAGGPRGPAGGGRRGFRRGGGSGRGFGGQDPADRTELPDPLAFRKVYADGREEVIRGGRIVAVTARTLRDIDAAGTDRNVFTRRLAGFGPSAVTIVAPSVLITDLDVRPTEDNSEKPPLIPPPA
jgi:predicted Zn-dependent protease